MRRRLIYLTNPEKKVLANWPRLLGKFVSREWMTVFGWLGAGALLAGLFRLGWSDHSFRAFLKATYVPTGLRFDNPSSYVPFLLVISFAVLLGMALEIPRHFWRGLRSWWAGVTSGLALFSFACTLGLLVRSPQAAVRLWSIGKYVGAFFVLSFLLFLKASVSAERVVSEEELLVPSYKRRTAGTRMPESDDPIETWEDDALGRAALVDSICVKLLISKSPVIALFGSFGSGKTSTLNLLREHLADKAIVISFSTWLPGSQETLTAYLLSDIASQVQKQYVVPGLRKSARRMASALGKTVPFFQTLSEVIPATTQKDDIENLKTALSRLPKRVVVLLDEIDRMEKDELLTLLKIIRGISTLPNLSFVCAGDRTTIIKAVKGKMDEDSIRYFEKFFPVAIKVSDPNPDALRKAGIDRLVRAFKQRDWFDGEPDEKDFRTSVEAIWQERIAPFCPNLRAIGLLANDVSISAAPLRREVHPVDLILVQMLQRFEPQVYELLSQNSSVLTGGESILRGGEYQTDQERIASEKTFLSELEAAVPAKDLTIVKGVLTEMFPRLSKIQGHPRVLRVKRAEREGESEKRISEAGIFPAYFRYELPTAMFSSAELDSLFRQMGSTSDEETRRRIFVRVLQSMEKGSLKRDDFLRKLAEAVKGIVPVPVGRSIVHAIARNADKLVYDMMAPFGEAGHALRIILRVCERLPRAERIRIMSDVIEEAADDTLALRVLTTLTGHHDDFDLEVSMADLSPEFAKRMRTRYGRDVDATNIDLSTSDPMAFDLWGQQLQKEGVTFDREERAIQHDFWVRYVGNSRIHLARAFRAFLLPPWIYRQDPSIAVENKISVAKLKELYEQLPEESGLTREDRVSLRTLERFLAGEFKGGTGPDSLYEDRDMQPS